MASQEINGKKIKSLDEITAAYLIDCSQILTTLRNGARKIRGLDLFKQVEVTHIPPATTLLSTRVF